MIKFNVRKVVFTEDFATKLAGETFVCDRTLARDLVNEGVAKYEVEEPAPIEEVEPLEGESIETEQSSPIEVEDALTVEQVEEPTLIEETEEVILPKTAPQKKK